MEKYLRAIVYSTCIALSFRVIYHVLHGTEGYLTVPMDDFYYYYTIGKNIVVHGISTYDGITKTNGYHPLWMGVIVFLHLITANIKVFFVLLAAITCLTSIITFELLCTLILRRLPQTIFSLAAVVYASLSYAWMNTWSMEICIAIPLYLYTLLKFHTLMKSEHISNRQAIGFGFLLSLLIISRIDLLLFATLIIGVWIFRRKKKKYIPTEFLYICIGSIPAALYLLSNLIWFDSLLPLSGNAKQIKNFFPINNHFLTELLALREALPALMVMTVLAIVILFRKRPFFFKEDDTIPLLAVCYPILYFIIHSMASDWMIQPWYLFTLPLAAALGLVLIGSLWKFTLSIRFRNSIEIGSAVLICFVLASKLFAITYNQTVQWSPHPGSIYSHAKKIAQFTKDHPGIYAMGDRAGLTQVITDRQIIQLEGLTVDKPFLKYYKIESNLMNVLRTYSVDYLIVTKFIPLGKSAQGYFLEYPFRSTSGVLSKKISGYVNVEPVYTYIAPDSGLVNKGLAPGPATYTYIFPVHR